MAGVSVAVNNKTYFLACADGDEARLTDLAARVDTQIREIVAQTGPLTESLLLLMAAIQFADASDEAGTGGSAMPSEQLEAAAARLEAIAERMAKA